MKVAVAQVKAEQLKEKNIEKAEKYVSQAKKENVDLIVFPEIYMQYVPSNSEIKLADIAESIEGDFVKGMSQIAKDNGVYIIFGMYEKHPEDAERAFNTAVLINSSGDVIYSYRKTHLYDAFITKESDRVIPGEDSYVVVETDIGKIGIMICYEVRFPEIARKLTLEGADVIVVPTAWVKGELKDIHWSTLLQARAIENTTYMVGANQIGNIFTGYSMIYDPMGVRVAGAGEEECLITSIVDVKRTERVRKVLPSIANRKPNFY